MLSGRDRAPRHARGARCDRPRGRRARARRCARSGSGHSFTEIALTDGVAVDVGRARPGARRSIAPRAWSRSRPGSCSATLNRRLDELGLAFENLGDIDRQTLAGSISTGTHGPARGFAQRLGAGRGGRARARRRLLARDLGRRPIQPARRGADRPRGARADLRGHGPRRARLHAPPRRQPAAARRDARRPRRAHRGERPLRVLRLPAHRTALCRESRRTDEPPRPRSRARPSTRRR